VVVVLVLVVALVVVVMMMMMTMIYKLYLHVVGLGWPHFSYRSR
jgi:hypothetical protein